MTRAKKSFRQELTKEQQALILQNTGMEAEELELTENALRVQTDLEAIMRPPAGAVSRYPGPRPA